MNLRLWTMGSLTYWALTDPDARYEDTRNAGARRNWQDRPTGSAAPIRPWPSGAGRLTVWPAAVRLGGPGYLGPRARRCRGGVHLVLPGPGRPRCRRGG